MFISHKSNIILQIEDTEWQCRRKSKGMTKPDYWTWIATITSGNNVEIKAFGMEADWAPTENVFEYDGGLEAGLKLGKKFSLAISGIVSNYYGVQDYKTTIGIKYKL